MMTPNPAWEGLLHEAQSETDLEIVAEKAASAEGAMWCRVQELNASSDGHLELEAIKHGYQELLKIRTERLGWPGLFQDGSSNLE
jgi:hypothetical protein